MKVTIVVFGKTSNPSVQGLMDDYVKRISSFTPVEVVVLAEEKMAKTITAQQVKDRETDRFLKVFDLRSFLVACDVRGKRMTSEHFAQRLEEVSLQYPSVTFVVGGSLGLSETILQKSHARISFSDMTFPHDLFRVFLLEQVYRGFMISNNRKYHR